MSLLFEPVGPDWICQWCTYRIPDEEWNVGPKGYERCPQCGEELESFEQSDEERKVWYTL